MTSVRSQPSLTAASRVPRCSGIVISPRTCSGTMNSWLATLACRPIRDPCIRLMSTLASVTTMRRRGVLTAWSRPRRPGRRNRGVERGRRRRGREERRRLLLSEEALHADAADAGRAVGGRRAAGTDGRGIRPREAAASPGSGPQALSGCVGRRTSPAWAAERARCGCRRRTCSACEASRAPIVPGTPKSR